MEKMRAAVVKLASSIWMTTVIGVVVGAVFGLLLSLTSGSNSTTATLLLRVDEPIGPNQIMSMAPSSPDSRQSYLSGEIVYLSSAGFADAVADELKQAELPILTAVQRGQSAVVELAARAADADAAKHTLGVAVKLYEGRAQQLARERNEAALTAINDVLDRVRDDTNRWAAANNQLVDITGLENRLKQLDQQKLAIEAQLERPAAVQVVSPVGAAADAPVVDPTLGVIGGGLVGGVLALAGALALRSRIGVISTTGQVARNGVRVLAPTIKLGSRGCLESVRSGRFLYGQLGSALPGPILVVGVSERSGSASVAELIKRASAEHTSSVAVEAAEHFRGLNRERTRGAFQDMVQGGDTQTVVVDGGSMAASPQLVDIIDLVAQVVLVVRLGSDVEDDLAGALGLVSAHPAAISAVCVRVGRFGA